MNAEANEEKIELTLERRQVSILAAFALVLLGVVFALGVLVGRQLASAVLAAPAQPPANDLRALDAAKPVKAAPAPAPAPSADESDSSEKSAEKSAVASAKDEKPAEAAKAKAQGEEKFKAAAEKAKPAEKPSDDDASADDQKGSAKADEKPAPLVNANAKDSVKPPPAKLAQADENAPPKVQSPKSKVQTPDNSGETLVVAPEKPVHVAPPAEADATPMPAPPEKPGKYTVQFYATQDKKDALRLVARAKSFGLKAYVVTAHLGEKGTWYRVRAGAFETRDAAGDYQKDIDRELKVTSAVMSTAN